VIGEKMIEAKEKDEHRGTENTEGHGENFFSVGGKAKSKTKQKKLFVESFW
jgi:hypothetical protein